MGERQQNNIRILPWALRWEAEMVLHWAPLWVPYSENSLNMRWRGSDLDSLKVDYWQWTYAHPQAHLNFTGFRTSASHRLSNSPLIAENYREGR